MDDPSVKELLASVQLTLADAIRVQRLALANIVALEQRLDKVLTENTRLREQVHAAGIQSALGRLQ